MYESLAFYEIHRARMAFIHEVTLRQYCLPYSGRDVLEERDLEIERTLINKSRHEPGRT